MLERVLVCLVAGGHLLIEGVPGLAKTLTIKTTAAVLGGTFRRVQFTPDLVPSDLVGTRIYRPDTGGFDTEEGPGLLQLPARGRDQPRAGEGAVGAARGDAGAAGDDRPRHPPRARPVPRDGDAEPDRVGGHLPAPRGAGRPLHAQDRRRLPEPRRGADGRAALARRPPRRCAGARARSLEGLRGPRSTSTSTLALAYAVSLAEATRIRRRRARRLSRYIEYGASPRGPIALVQSARALALHGRDYVLGTDPLARQGRSGTGSCSRTARSPSSGRRTMCSTRCSRQSRRPRSSSGGR